MIESARLIEQYADGLSFDEFATDSQVRDAVERRFTIIGEALIRLSRDAPDLHDRIDATGPIRRFRNIVVHRYDHVDPAIVFGIILDDLPRLRTQAEALLNELEAS